MLIVRVEVWPNGVEKDARIIASMAIDELTDDEYDVASHELGINEYRHRFQFKLARQNSIFAIVAKAALKAAKLSRVK